MLSIGAGVFVVAGAALLAGGCPSPVKETTRIERANVPVALEATTDQLLDRYNQQARAVRSINAGIELRPIAGSAYSGVIQEYHEVNGFLLAQKPLHIRVIGQAPVVAKNIFDMVSDGETFSIYIPSKNKFITGPASFERPSAKPIENLRPQHLLEAIFWPEIPPHATLLFEESNGFGPDVSRFYVLTLLRQARSGPEIERKIWFNRADLNVARIQVFDPGGKLAADVRYADWRPVADVRYPHQVWIARPRADYQLEIRIKKLALNEGVAADRFRLEQPPGTELVRVGPEAGPTEEQL